MSKGKKDNLFQSLLFPIVMILAGLLLTICSNSILNVALCIIGILFIIYSIISFVKKKYFKGIIMLIVGLIIIYFGVKLLEIALFALGLLLLFVGIYNIIRLTIKKNISLFTVISQVIAIVVGILLLLYSLKGINYVIYLAGIFLIVYGIYQIILVLIRK